jgi:ComF family protein
MRQIEAGFDFLYPARCSGCGSEGAIWCESCQTQVRVIAGRFCDWCGEPLSSAVSCRLCKARDLPLKARSYAYYEGPLARALLMLKYRPNRTLANLIGEWLSAVVQSEGWGITRVVPVPLGPDRMRQRGYNQAALLSLSLAKQIEVPNESDLLERHRETRSQVGLDAPERHLNVAGAFRVRRPVKSDEALLLVDDLFTTGATMAACGHALIESGAHQLYGLTVARAVGRK